MVPPREQEWRQGAGGSRMWERQEERTRADARKCDCLGQEREAAEEVATEHERAPKRAFLGDRIIHSVKTQRAGMGKS